VRFPSATYISHRIVAGEVCLVGDDVKIPTLRHSPQGKLLFRRNKERERRMGYPLSLIANSSELEAVFQRNEL
jgi:hypothetical protein